MIEKSPQNVRRALLAAGLAASGLLLNAAVKSDNKSAEVAMIEQLDKKGPVELLNGTVVLREGVALRSQPVTKDNRPDSGERSNVVSRVKEGKALVLNQPIEHTAENGDTWFGFTYAAEKTQGDDAKELADKMVWVNKTQLSRQAPEKGGDPFIEVWQDHDYAENPTIKADFDNGQVLVYGKEGDVPAALAIEVDASNVQAYQPDSYKQSLAGTDRPTPGYQA